jgi:hypothetical protein
MNWYGSAYSPHLGGPGIFHVCTQRKLEGILSEREGKAYSLGLVFAGGSLVFASDSLWKAQPYIHSRKRPTHPDPMPGPASSLVPSP